MDWTDLGTYNLTADQWYLTPVIATGEYFRLTFTGIQETERFGIASFDAAGARFGLTVFRASYEPIIVRMPKPVTLGDRRLGVRQWNRKPLTVKVEVSDQLEPVSGESFFFDLTTVETASEDDEIPLVRAEEMVKISVGHLLGALLSPSKPPLIDPTEAISYWPLTASSGNESDLISGNTLINNNAVGSINDATITDVFLSPNARTFNGINQYLSCASNASLQCGDINFTLFLSVWLNNINDSQILMSKDGSPNSKREYNLYYEVSLKAFCFEVYRLGGTTVLLRSIAITPLVNNWYFIVAWHDASTRQIFIQVNGGEVNRRATGGALQPASDGEFRLGSSALYPGVVMLSGRLNHCGLIKRILSPTERFNLYNNALGLHYNNWG